MHRVPLHARWSTPLTLLAVVFAAAACHATPPAPCAKPGLPVSLSIEPAGKLLRGESGQIIVVATTLVDSDNFSLDVELPDDIEHYSGDLHWHGAVRANTRFRLGFVIRVPVEGASTITARARLVAGDAGAFEATASYPLGSEPAATAAERGTLTERGGEKLREFAVP